MAVSSFKGATSSSGGAATGFQLYTGTDGYTTFTFETAQPSGVYRISSAVQGDTSFDVYAIAEDGTLSGYTSIAVLVADKPIKNVVLYGGTPEDVLVFDFKTTATRVESGAINSGAAPYLTSVSTSLLSDIDDSTVVSGGNFASDVTFIFRGSDLVERSAKAVVRNSSLEAEVTRPDVMPEEFGPYDLIASNPDIPEQVEGNNVLSNAINAGTAPVWITSDTIFWEKGETTFLNLVAEDTEDSDVDYSIVSGSLLSGLSLNQETGAITGDDSALVAEQFTEFTVRATDAGGNTKDKTFKLYVDRYSVHSWYFDVFATAGELERTLLTELSV